MGCKSCGKGDVVQPESPPCICTGPGWCERHKMTKGPNLFRSCQKKAGMRIQFDQLVEAGGLKSKNPPREVKITAEEQQQREQDIKEIIKIAEEAEKVGVNIENIDDLDGVGTKLEKIISSLGITNEKIKRFLGIKNCGCGKRKAFMNKILSYIPKKED